MSAASTPHTNFLLSHLTSPLSGIEVDYIHQTLQEFISFASARGGAESGWNGYFYELLANAQLMSNFWSRLTDLYNMDSVSTFSRGWGNVGGGNGVGMGMGDEPLSSTSSSSTTTTGTTTTIPSHLYLPTSNYIPTTVSSTPNPIISQFQHTTRYLATNAMLFVEQVMASIQTRFGPLDFAQDLWAFATPFRLRTAVLSKKIRQWESRQKNQGGTNMDDNNGMNNNNYPTPTQTTISYTAGSPTPSSIPIYPSPQTSSPPLPKSLKGLTLRINGNGASYGN